jgi:hypothetical protein
MPGCQLLVLSPADLFAGHLVGAAPNDLLLRVVDLGFVIHALMALHERFNLVTLTNGVDEEGMAAIIWPSAAIPRDGCQDGFAYSLRPCTHPVNSISH